MPDRVEVYETNRLLSDGQIQRFISSTVLPHHRTLTNSNGRTLTNSNGRTLTNSDRVSWSHALTDSRPAPPSFQKKKKTGNYAYPNLVGDVQRRPVPQGNPFLISVPQGTQRDFPGNRANFYHNTQGMPTKFPHQFSVSQGRQEFLIPQATHGKAFSIPHSTGAKVVSGYREDISNHNRMSEGISTFPLGIQDKIISFPRGSQGEISRVPVLTTEENDTIANQAGKGEIVDFPSGTLSLSHEPSGLKEKADDIIIVHQGTPEELINVVQETLQEIMGVPQGNHISKGTAEEVTFYDETGKEITGFLCGNSGGNLGHGSGKHDSSWICR
ncbi:uncharacterized protein LOC111122290 isoform X2 [Crassostrea virginica]